MGRPSELTTDVERKVCEAIRAGNVPEVAAAYAGIGARTYYTWMRRGRREPGPYRQFLQSVEKALADFEVRNVALVQQAAPASWQAAMTLLERRFPQRWGRRDRVDHHFIREQAEEIAAESGIPVEQVERDIVLAIEAAR